MVIQRIQTVWLLLATIAMGAYAALPVLNVAGAAMHSLDIGGWLLTLQVVIAVVTLIPIFKYKDLKRQIGLTRMLLVMTLTLLAVGPVLLYRLADAQLTYWYALPCASLVLTFLALTGMKRDKKLLSDSERLR